MIKDIYVIFSDLTKDEKIQLFNLLKEDFIDNEDADMNDAHEQRFSFLQQSKKLAEKEQISNTPQCLSKSNSITVNFLREVLKTAIPIWNDCISYAVKAPR